MFEKKNWLAALAASIALMSVLICVGCKNSADGNVGVGARSGDSNQLPLPEVGDLILKNGSVIPAAEINVSHKDEAMAIVYWVDVSNRKFMGMGVEIGNNIKWSNGGLLAGFDQKDASLENEWKEKLAIQYATKGFQGIDVDLYDVWNDFGNAFQQSEKAKGATNDWGTPGKYPAFDYAKTYGETYNLPEEYKTGWFLPTALSLYEVGKNKNAINSVLEKLSNQQLTSQTKCWCSATNTGTPGRWFGVTLDINNIGGLINFTQVSGNDFNKSEEKSVASVRVFQY